MGQDNSFRSLEKPTELTMNSLNEKIRVFDRNKKWLAEYPKTKRSSNEIDELNKNDFKEALKDFFSDNSLVLKNSVEV